MRSLKYSAREMLTAISLKRLPPTGRFGVPVFPGCPSDQRRSTCVEGSPPLTAGVTCATSSWAVLITSFPWIRQRCPPDWGKAGQPQPLFSWPEVSGLRSTSSACLREQADPRKVFSFPSHLLSVYPAQPVGFATRQGVLHL